MSYAQRIPSTLRTCSRTFGIALTSLIAALSTCGAASPPPGSPAATVVESAAAPAAPVYNAPAAR